MTADSCSDTLRPLNSGEVYMKRRLFYGVAAAILALAASPAGAADIYFTSPITQDQFKSLTKEAGAALGYRNLAPASAW